MQHVQDLRQLLANREVEEKNQRKLYEAKKTSFEHLEKLKAVKGFFLNLIRTISDQGFALSETQELEYRETQTWFDNELPTLYARCKEDFEDAKRELKDARNEVQLAWSRLAKAQDEFRNRHFNS